MIYDNIYTQKLLVAVFGLLNNISNEFHKNKADSIKLPFVINSTDSEIEWVKNEALRVFDNSIKSLPIVKGKLRNITKDIDITDLTSKYANTRFYEMDSNGVKRAIYVESQRIPFTMPLELILETSTMSEFDKVESMLIDAFFAIKQDYFYYYGVAIPFTISFPSTFNTSMPSSDFEVNTNGSIITDFNIVINSVYPSINWATKKYESDKMVNIDLFINGEKFNNDE